MPKPADLPRTIILLGAGASSADGAPLQADLFRNYFKSRQKSLTDTPIHHQWDRELATFFQDFFGIDVDHDALDGIPFPTFEEVLGLIEIAESQKESFRDWGTFHLVDAQAKPRLQHMRDVLVLLIAEALDNARSRAKKQWHHTLIRNLEPDLGRTSFISLNYDILLDNALLEPYPKWDLDYGVDFVNYKNGTWTLPRKHKSVRLFKLHGSLNWLYCPTCRTVELTPKEGGVCRLKWEPASCLCAECETPAIPIIVPPTYFKVLSNLYLQQVWNSAEREMMSCDRIVFCGYSFPDADIHVRYILKRMEVNRRSMPEVFIVNEFNGKSGHSRDEERKRYTRFFRDKRRVHWTDLSFEQFASNPALVEDASHWK